MTAPVDPPTATERTVVVDGLTYGPVAQSSSWWAQRRPDLDRYLSSIETWPLLDRIAALEALHTLLVATAHALENENTALEAENARLREERDMLRRAYEGE